MGFAFPTLRELANKTQAEEASSMAKIFRCWRCLKQLIGTTRNDYLAIGIFEFPVIRDSTDCNWRQCKGCGEIVCKSCYANRHEYCCNNDRIACRERAQALADLGFQTPPKNIMSPALHTEADGTNQNQNKNIQEENMSDFKIVYLIVERGVEPNRQVFWRSAGSAFICRDGSLNLKLDIHPGLTFNIRNPKSIGEREEAESFPEVANQNGNGNGNGHKAEIGTPVSKKNGAKTRPKPKDGIPF